MAFMLRLRFMNLCAREADWKIGLHDEFFIIELGNVIGRRVFRQRIGNAAITQDFFSLGINSVRKFQFANRQVFIFPNLESGPFPIHLSIVIPAKAGIQRRTSVRHKTHTTR